MIKQFVFLIFTVSLLLSCSSEETTWVKLTGETMGTYYAITYQDQASTSYQAEIDSLLQEINFSVSTYIPTSLLSEFNALRDTAILVEIDKHFLINFKKSVEVYRDTEGAFNPAILPLLRAWGFGPDRKTTIENSSIDSLIKLTDLEKISLVGTQLKKQNPYIELDFSAIAKGYAVDQIGQLLHEQEITNFYVEIGGEALGRGKNAKDQAWQVGIEKPIEDSFGEIQEIIALENRAIATSGNYRNFVEINGQKFGHEINPKTGKPEKTNLLSVSVLAPDCMTADALATGFMILGKEKTLEYANRHPEIEVLLVLGNENGGFEEVKSKHFLRR